MGMPPLTGMPLPTGMPPAAPTVPLTGLQVDHARPKAVIQRRQYAQGEMPPPDDQPASNGSQYRSPAGVAASPAAGAAKANTSSNRIDPSQIPRPDAARPAETWSTRANVGQCPPPATSAYIVDDDGNCSPRYMRLTLNQVINTGELLTSSGMPFAVVAQPLAEVPPCDGPVPVVDFGDLGPVRCERCRAYVNPFFAFNDGGRSYTCNLCGHVNQTPRDYYCEIDHNGYRRDHRERAELCRGVCDFVAPAEYQARPPRPPPIVVLLEASIASVTSGIFHAVIASLGAILPTLPPYTEFALVTFDEGVHFYHVGAEGTLRTMSVPDNTEVCLPLPPSALLMRLGDALDHVEQILKALPELVAHSQKADTAFGSALQACHLLLEKTGGRLLCFQNVLPVLGHMKLQQRDDVRLYGTDKERALFAPPEGTGWEALAKEMAKAQVCVSSFHFTSSAYVDVAACALLATRTGGQVYLYQSCVPEQRDVWALKLEVELGRNLRRDFGFEGVMRFRCSKGLSVDDYLMGCTPPPGQMEVDVPGIDADHAFAVTLKHDDKLEDGAPAYVQCALLYTTSAGQRRVRVLTLGLQSTSAMASLYRYADLDALLNVMLRQSIALARKQNMHQVRESVVNATVKMLYCYRKMCASASTAAGQLILPESLKLLPLYTLSLTKNGVLRAGTDVRADERNALMAAGSRMPVASSVAFVYPRLFGVHTLDEYACALEADGTPRLPSMTSLSVEKLEADGAFLLDDATALYLWIGRGVPAAFLEQLLRVRTLEGYDCSRLRVPTLDNDVSIRANRLVNAVRSQRPQLFQSVRVLTAKDPLEGRFLSMLTEDRAQTAMSYVEFLCHVHRQIQQKFTT